MTTDNGMTSDTVADAVSPPVADVANGKVSADTVISIEPGLPRHDTETTREYRSRYERERRAGIRGTGDKGSGTPPDATEDATPADDTAVADAAASVVAKRKANKAKKDKSADTEPKVTPAQIAETEQFLTGMIGLAADTSTQVWTRKLIRVGYQPPQFPPDNAATIAKVWAPFVAPYLTATENAALAVAAVTTVMVVQGHRANVKESIKEWEKDRKARGLTVPR